MKPLLNFKATEIFEKNYKASNRILLNIGGARSSKSYSITQVLIVKLLRQNYKKVLITRKTLPALKQTAYKLFIDLLKEYNLYKISQHNKSDRIYWLKNNYILFTSIDDPEKIKSTEWNYIWMEEANEFTYEDFITLKTRLSAPMGRYEFNQMFLTLNPIDEQGWIKEKLLNGKQKGVNYIHSTYKDNPFLSSDYIKSLEDLKNEDIDYWRIYGLGEWIEKIDLIYKNYKIESFNFIKNEEQVIYGLDFGFNNPTALIEIVIKDDIYYIKEILYETKLTNAELIERLKLLNLPEYAYIYADSSEPQRIEEIYKTGFNIHSSNKNIKDGIDYCKSKKLIIHPDSTNLIYELKHYKWKKDKNNNILDEPVKFNDHLIDAMRYAIYTHSFKQEIKFAFI